MITRIKSPSAAHTWRQYPQPGSGTQADPHDWLSVSTQSGSVSTVPVADGEGEAEKWYTAKLTASQLYTFSLGGLDEMSTTVTIYKDGVQVAQSVLDDINWTWSCSYTPAETATYTIKISTYYYGGGTSTLSVTPTPATITPWTEKANGVYASTGFDEGAGWTPRRYAGTKAAGLSPSILPHRKNLIFFVKGESGLSDLANYPVALTAEGTASFADNAFDFPSENYWRINVDAADKLNLGTGNWTVEIEFSGSPKHANYPFILSGGSWFGSSGIGFIYKHDSHPTTASMHWSNGTTLVGQTQLTDNTIYKLRFVRNGNILLYYLDDVLDNSLTLSPDASGFSVNFNADSGDTMGGMQIACSKWDGNAGQFRGKIYSIKIWNVAIL